MKRLRCAANLERRMMTTSVGCGDGCELPYDSIKESGDFRSCHDVPAMSSLWSLLEDKHNDRPRLLSMPTRQRQQSLLQRERIPNDGSRICRREEERTAAWPRR